MKPLEVVLQVSQSQKIPPRSLPLADKKNIELIFHYQAEKKKIAKLNIT